MRLWYTCAAVMFLGVLQAKGHPAVDEFTTFFKTLVKSSGIVGSSLVVLADGEVVASVYEGVANADTKRPVDERTIYHWASITKTLTGIAIMQLRDRGLVSLDDPIVKYVPELRQVHSRFGPIDKVTLRQLLSHTAGFRGPTWPWGGDKPWHPHEPQDWAQLVAMFPYTEIEFEPGSKYSYSNPGIVFLGRVIERITLDDYEVYIDKNIFKPLEMHRSYFDATPYHLLPDRSASYYVENGKRTAARFDVNTGITVSNGGLNAPLPDMVKYMQFLMGHGSRQAVYDGVLKRASLEEMFKPIAPVAERQGRATRIGLTYFVDDWQGRRVIQHSGGQNGFISHFFIDPASKGGYIVAFNTQVDTKDPKERSTRQIDADLSDFAYEKLFPVLRPR